jgi:hypothetical protein
MQRQRERKFRDLAVEQRCSAFKTIRIVARSTFARISARA